MFLKCEFWQLQLVIIGIFLHLADVLYQKQVNLPRKSSPRSSRRFSVLIKVTLAFLGFEPWAFRSPPANNFYHISNNLGSKSDQNLSFGFCFVLLFSEFLFHTSPFFE